MQKSTSGAHLVCAWAELELYTCRGFFWSWTPSCNVFLAFNSSSWRVSGVWLLNAAWNWRWANLCHLISNKVWTIIYCWKALDVYFPTPLRACHLEFCSSGKSISSAGRSESNSISSPLLASLSEFCSGPSISARNYLKSQKNTQTIVKSRNVNLT